MGTEVGAAVAAGIDDGLSSPGDGATIIVAMPDLAGRLVGKRMTGRHFREGGRGGTRLCEVVLGWGLGHELLPGLAGLGWEHGYGDVLAIPDPATARRLSWWDETTLVLADAHDADGAPLAIAPRAILRGQLARAAALGFEAVAACELELTLFRETSATLDAKGYRGLEPAFPLGPELVETSGRCEPFLGELRRHLEASGLPVESVKAEYAAGQVELVLEPAGALEMADRHAVYKLAVRELARRHGLEASFMAKWHEDAAGSSSHVHVSLVDEAGVNIFAAGDDGALHAFVAGLQRYARDVFLLWAPYPNSYRRHRAGTFAPTSAAWGVDNRTAAFRIAGGGAGRHVENRIPGADVNPYLALAATLAAGLAGIEERLRPTGDAGRANAYARDDLPALPRSAEEALAGFRDGAFARRAFGGAVVDHLAATLAAELELSRLPVSDWERRRLFAI